MTIPLAAPSLSFIDFIPHTVDARCRRACRAAYNLLKLPAMELNTADRNERHIVLMRRAGYIALFGNLALAYVKIFLSKVSGSLAVMGDGIDSLTDVAIALMTLIVSTVVSRPGDKEHPWGHGRAETTATMALSFVIFFAGAQPCRP